MRRFMFLAAAMTFVSILGCKHTAGICDCPGGCCDTCGAYGGMIKAEPLPVMPKVNGDKKGAENKENEPKEIQLDKELPLGNEK
ncbi:MAG: hypothetical protein AB7K24_04120 [Gemmataceae bacterium]